MKWNTTPKPKLCPSDFENVGLDGNFDKYIKRLPIRIGVERTNTLKEKAAVKKYTKYSRPELVEIIEKYKK